MKTEKLLFPLFALLVAFGTASCVSDDWDGDGGYYGRDRYYRDDYYRDRRDWEYERRRERELDRRERELDRRERRGSGSHGGFARAGSFQAGGAVECGVPGSRPVRTVRIVATSGSVAVNTVVLREGPAKTSYTVSRRLNSGETAEIDLGGSRNATGFRISTGGKGGFDVYVR